METMKEALDAVREAQERFARVMDALCEKIEGLPDNPRITRLGKNCFSVPMSALGNNWTPLHHDFKAQYRAIVEDIRGIKPFEGLERLRNIVKSKCLNNKKQGKVNLHPDVIRHLTDAMARS